MKDIVFLGGKEIGYECLKHLLENAGTLGVRVIAVLTNDRKIHLQNNFSVKELCEKFSVPVLYSLNELLKIKTCDILFSVQYHEILKNVHIEKAKEIAANLHMAPLPEYRGCNQFSFAIIDEAKEFGVTIHRMEGKIDGGDIMFERRFPVEKNVFVSALYEKTFQESVLLFKESISKIIEGKYFFIPQNNFAGKRKTSFHLRNEIDKIKHIDLNWEKEKILRYFRATYFPPFPPPYAIINGEKIDITPDWIEKNL